MFPKALLLFVICCNWDESFVPISYHPPPPPPHPIHLWLLSLIVVIVVANATKLYIFIYLSSSFDESKVKDITLNYTLQIVSSIYCQPVYLKGKGGLSHCKRIPLQSCLAVRPWTLLDPPTKTIWRRTRAVLWLGISDSNAETFSSCSADENKNMIKSFKPAS